MTIALNLLSVFHKQFFITIIAIGNHERVDDLGIPALDR